MKDSKGRFAEWAQGGCSGSARGMQFAVEAAEDGPAAGHGPRQPQEFAGVVAGAAVDVDELAVEIVEHLEVGGTLGQKHRRAACEGLHVGFVRAPLDEGEQVLEETAFAARPHHEGRDALFVFGHCVAL